MKGSSALIPNNRNRCIKLLEGLGFEEDGDELVMFFDLNPVSENELVERYLQIARSEPYNLNWQTGDDACVADNMLGVFKDNGVEYTKHDIVEDVLDSFSEQAAPQEAGRRKKSRRSTKKRMNKKKRSTRRKHRRTKK